MFKGRRKQSNVSSYKEDCLTRDLYVKHVLNIIDIIAEKYKEKREFNQASTDEKGITFVVEGKWGIGKSFVLDKIKFELEQREDIFLICYNCWENDYYNEPLESMANSMTVSCNDRKLIRKFVRKTLKKLRELSAYTSTIESVISLFVHIKIALGLKCASGLFSILGKSNQSQNNLAILLNRVKKSFKAITKKKTIVIIVDDLDRCVPQYAIKVLERLHHIFGQIDGIVTILAYDEEQLKHSIQMMFGEEVKMELYLKKFIDFKIPLDIGQLSGSIVQNEKAFFWDFDLCDDDDEYNISELISASGLEIRTVEKLLRKAQIINSIIFYNQSQHLDILFFEMLYIFLEHKFKNDSNDFHRDKFIYEDYFWVYCVDKHKEVKAFIGATMYYYLLEKGRLFQEEVISSEGEIVKFNDQYFNRCFWIFYMIFDHTNVEKTFASSLGTSLVEELIEEVKICKQFVEMCNIIQ